MKRKLIIVGLWVVFGSMIAGPLYVFLDVWLEGPQVVWFNHRCERIVQERGLRGQSREAVEQALGTPTSVRTYLPHRSGEFTLNYAPHPLFPYAQFQAHFRHDKLVNTEMFDD